MAKRNQRILTWFILLVFLHGCSFNVAMKGYSNIERNSNKKTVPLSVGIVVPSHMLNKIINIQGTYIKLFPGFHTTIRNIYKDLFDKIEIVKENDIIEHSYDVLINADCNIINNNELLFTATVLNGNKEYFKISKFKYIEGTPGLSALMYIVLTFTIIGAPIAISLSNSEREEKVNKALVSILENSKNELYIAIGKLTSPRYKKETEI